MPAASRPFIRSIFEGGFQPIDDRESPLEMSNEHPNAKIEEERTAAENAKAVLGWLTPKNARTDRIIFILRYAANVATTAAFSLTC